MIEQTRESGGVEVNGSQAMERRQPDVALSANVPPEVRKAVRQAAADQGTTVRSILLKALRQAGIIDIDDNEVMDRRTLVSGRRQAEP